MSIGIMDADMATYTLVPFNLEVMKLSAYYKRKGEIVVLSPHFTPERNTKFIYRKDYNDGDFPLALQRRATEKSMAPAILFDPASERKTLPPMEIIVPAIIPLMIFFSI